MAQIGPCDTTTILNQELRAVPVTIRLPKHSLLPARSYLRVRDGETERSDGLKVQSEVMDRETTLWNSHATFISNAGPHSCFCFPTAERQTIRDLQGCDSIYVHSTAWIYSIRPGSICSGASEPVMSYAFWHAILTSRSRLSFELKYTATLDSEHELLLQLRMNNTKQYRY